MFVLTLILLVPISAFFDFGDRADGRPAHQAQVLAERGDRRATKVLRLKEEPGNFFTIVQIGVNSVAILAGILGEKHVSDLVFAALTLYMSATYALRVANIGSFLVVTLLFIQFADLIPKRIAMTFPERCAVVVIEPISSLLRVLKPVVDLQRGGGRDASRSASRPSRWTRSPPRTSPPMVDAGAEAGVLHKHELHLIENVFELDSKGITAIMTPRRRDLPDAGRDRRQRAASWSASRTRNTWSAVTTWTTCWATSTRRTSCNGCWPTRAPRCSATSAGIYDKNVLVIPDTPTLSESLTRFREMHESFAVVMERVRARGGHRHARRHRRRANGDILYSAEDEQIVRRDETSWLVDGVTPLVDPKKALELDSLPGEDYVDTAAGLVIYSPKRIPKKSESITVAGYRFEVLDIDHHKIDQLLVSRLPDAVTPSAATAGGPLTRSESRG